MSFIITFYFHFNSSIVNKSNSYKIYCIIKIKVIKIPQIIIYDLIKLRKTIILSINLILIIQFILF